MNNISNNMGFKAGLDVTDFNRGVDQMNAKATTAASTLASIFAPAGKSISDLSVKVDESIGAFDKMINRIANATSRGTGAKYTEDLESLVTILSRLKADVSSQMPTTGIDKMNEAFIQATVNLEHLENQLRKLAQTQQQLANQRNIAGLVASTTASRVGAGNTGDEIQWWLGAMDQQRPSTGTIQHSRADLDEHFREMERRQASGLSNQYIPMSNVERWDQQQAYEAARRAQDIEYNRRRATTRSNYDVSMVDPDGMSLPPGVSQDATYWQMRAKERAIMNTPHGPDMPGLTPENHYKQRALQKAWESQAGPTGAYPANWEDLIRTHGSADRAYSYMNATGRNYTPADDYGVSLPQGTVPSREAVLMDELRRKNNQEEIRRNDPYMQEQRRGMNQFRAQQGAYAVDDAMQQYMWSSTHAGGISAAARAAGNNLTAVAGSFNMNPGYMVGAMMGVQGISFAVSQYYKLQEAMEAAAKDTSVLEKHLDKLHATANREVRFKFRLEDKDSKDLKAEQREADTDKAVRDATLPSDRKRLETAENRVSRLHKKKEMWEAAAEKQRKWAEGGYRGPSPLTRDEQLLLINNPHINSIDEEILNAEAEAEKIRGKVEPALEEDEKYKKESAARKAEIEKKEKEEAKSREYKKEQAKRYENSMSRFWKSTDAEQEKTGRVFSRKELEDKYNAYVEEQYMEGNIDTLQMADESIGTRGIDQAYKYRKAQRETNKEAKRMAQGYEADFSDDPYADARQEFQRRIEEIEQNFGNMSEAGRDAMKGLAGLNLERVIADRQDKENLSIRSSYRPSEGIVSRSTEDAELRARLTSPVDGEEKQRKEARDAEVKRLLQQIADNTTPDQTEEEEVEL